MRLPPNARRRRGVDPLEAYRQQKTRGQGGTMDAVDPLTRFRAKYSGTHPIDVPPVAAESTATRSPAPVVPTRTIAPRVLDAETDMERGVGRASALYQGLTFGLGDKISAGIKTLLPEVAGGSRGWNFRENLREMRTPLNDYRQRHPVESTVAEIAGGLPTVMASAPLSISARLAEAPAAVRIAGLMGEGAAMGGVVGGLDAIQPDASLEDVGRGAASGAATGAVVTPIAAPIVAGAVRGVTRAGARLARSDVADRIAALMGGDPVTPRGKAKAAIAGALESGGVNPAEAAKTTGLIEPAKPTPPASSNTGRRFPASEKTVTDYMAEKQLPREEAVKRLTAAGYDVPAAPYAIPNVIPTPEQKAQFEAERIARNEAVGLDEGRAVPATAVPMAGRAANDDIRRIAEEYRYGNAIEGETLDHPAKVDAEKAGVMAHAFEALKNDPTDPEVIAAYRALAKETRAQADALIKAGYKPEFMTDDPYKDSAEMMKDLAERKTIRVFKTNKENPHPLLTDEENDLFRWVHDVFGHAQSGNQFGPLGEERAFRDHASMFSPLARRAMATETRGQNSWVNFGPNKDLPITERPFSEQKAAVFPRELTGGYENIPHESPTTVMELGSRQVPALVRAARNVPTATAGQATDRFLSERAAGAGKRIERALNEATGHQSSDSWMPVEQLIDQRAAEARPLYEDAEKYGPIKNPETVAQIAALRKHPVFARAWARGQAMAEVEGSSATRRVVTQEGAAEIPRIAPDAAPKEPAPVPSGKPTSTREAIAAFQDRSAAAASRREGTSIQQQARAALERRSAEGALPDAPRRLVGGQLQEPRAAVAEESMQAPTVQQINRWKKGLDAVIQSGHGSENAVSREEARLFRQKLNEVLAKVDEEVPAYKQARQSYAGNSELVEASEAGAEHFKPGTPTGALARRLGEMSPGEREVYTANGLNKLVEKIRTIAVNPDMPEAGRSTNILQRIMGTEDAGERLGMLFPDEASFERFKAQVEDEALYPKTDRFLRGNSNTNAQQAESRTSIKTWADLAKSPFSKSARFRLVRNLMHGAMADEPLPPKVANEVAELATTTGYRLRALLQEMAADKAGREAGRRRLLSFSNAALAGGSAPAATEAERRRRTPPDEGR